MKGLNVTVLMGGASAERDVSLRSGQAVSRGLAEAGYEVCQVDPRDGALDIPTGVEAVFIALHGEYGEDGQVQFELNERRIPYTGSGSEASRLAFDKERSKQVLHIRGLALPAWEVLRAHDARHLVLPVVVKPVRQGSSIGVSRVRTESEWAAAVRNAFRYGDTVLVEAYIEGRELTVGIVGDEPLPPVEIVAPDNWYDYAAKYTKGACQYLAPAPIDAVAARRCQESALRTFEALGCRGFARVDFRLSDDGEPYVLELNSIPGFTEMSLLPKAAAEAGMTFSALCDRIVRLARVDD